MVERETYLLELKNKGNNNNSKPEEKKGGFGSNKGATEDKPKKKVDLPF
jgi:hypothetical protein